MAKPYSFRLSGRDRKTAFNYLVKRDGHKCRGCDRDDLPSNELTVDRIKAGAPYKINGKFQWGNLWLLCPKCQANKDKKGSAAKREADLDAPIARTLEFASGKESKMKFKGMAHVLIETFGPQQLSALLYACCEWADVREQTAKGYMKEITSLVGKFSTYDEEGTIYVTLKNRVVPEDIIPYYEDAKEYIEQHNNGQAKQSNIDTDIQHRQNGSAAKPEAVQKQTTKN